MAWIDIQPNAKGQRASSTGPRVTIGRRVHKNGSSGLLVGISGALLAEMEWPQVGALRVQHDPEKRLLRLSPGGHVKTRKTGPKGTGAYLGFSWSRATESKSAEVAAHVIEGGALIVTLPDWAAPAREGLRRAADAAAAAKARMAGTPSFGRPR